MNNFITGGRGFIGAQLALRLAERGEDVTLLNREGSEVPEFLSKNTRIRIVTGDVLNLESLEQGMKECDRIFHLAAYAKPWAKNKRHFYNVNVNGTINVLEAARKNGIKEAVVTSSAGTFGPQKNYELVREDKPRHRPFFTEYERTKQISIDKALDQFGEEIKIRVVSPSRVFGPGALTVSNAVTQLIISYSKGKFRFLPGNGNSMGNYAFIEDVVDGHISAMEEGKHGENYILGGANLTYNAFFEKVAEVTGNKHKMVHVPVPLIITGTHVMTAAADLTGKPPKLTPGFAKKYTHDWGLDLSKARKQLNYTVTPVETAIEKTVNYFEKKGLLK